MNNTDVIVIFGFVTLKLMLQYNMTQCCRGKSSEYFSVGRARAGGPITAIPNLHSSVPPIQFKLTNKLMQLFLTKLSNDFQRCITNKIEWCEYFYNSYFIFLKTQFSNLWLFELPLFFKFKLLLTATAIWAWKWGKRLKKKWKDWSCNNDIIEMCLFFVTNTAVILFEDNKIKVCVHVFVFVWYLRIECLFC